LADRLKLTNERLERTYTNHTSYTSPCLKQTPPAVVVGVDPAKYSKRLLLETLQIYVSKDEGSADRIRQVQLRHAPAKGERKGLPGGGEAQLPQGGRAPVRALRQALIQLLQHRHLDIIVLYRYFLTVLLIALPQEPKRLSVQLDESDYRSPGPRPN